MLVVAENRLARDLPLEGIGFEPSVPSAMGAGTNTGRQPRQLWRRKHACRIVGIDALGKPIFAERGQMPGTARRSDALVRATSRSQASRRAHAEGARRSRVNGNDAGLP